MSFQKVQYIDGVTPIGAKNLNDIQDAILGTKTANGTVVSQNADFAEVAEWADGNPNNEDRTGYFVCANVPVDGIVMKKATSIDDVKGVSIQAPAFAGNYTLDKLDREGNLLPKYSFVAIIGFVPVRDNGTCTVGGRCMPDDNGCAIPSSNSMGYQVVNRIDENRVLIIIEPNGDMVQRIKTKINQIQKDVTELQDAISSANRKWQHLKAIYLEKSASAYSEKVEVLGDTTKGVRVKVILPPDTTLPNNRLSLIASLNNNRTITVRAEGWTTTAEYTVCFFDIVPTDVTWTVDVTPYAKVIGGIVGNVEYAGGDKVRYIKVQTNDTYPIPANTVIEIWGLQ